MKKKPADAEYEEIQFQIAEDEVVKHQNAIIQYGEDAGLSPEELFFILTVINDRLGESLGLHVKSYYKKTDQPIQ